MLKLPEVVGVHVLWKLALALDEEPRLLPLAKYCTEVTVPSESRALARSWTCRLKAALVVDGSIVMVGGILEAATRLTKDVPEATTLPELSVARATTSTEPGLIPAKLV